MALSWCFCTAAASLCSAACGNDKPSTEPPSATSGRKRSALLMLLSVVLALVYQYAVAPVFGNTNEANILNSIPRVGPYLLNAWRQGCALSEDQVLASSYSEETIEQIEASCRGNNGVYRVSGATFLLFLLLALAAKCKPTFNREAWPAKYVMFLFLVTATAFIPNEPLNSPVYMQLARVCAAIFVIIQQIIFIDIAYNWNDSWVTKSNEAEAEEAGTGKKWLAAILISCGLLFAGSITVIGLLFGYFGGGGCTTNNTFISLTLILNLIVLAIQMAGEEASLLTSTVIGAYGSYLCYVAVTRNPDASCNPQLGEANIFGIVVGVALTIISLTWTGYSYTAAETISPSNAEPLTLANISGSGDGKDEEEGSNALKGVVTGSPNYGSTESAGKAAAAEDDAVPGTWRINVVLAFISAWYAMILTGWGSIEANGTAANPQVDKVSMWIVIASQWLMYALYCWTLVAPQMFPDREFS